MNQSRVLGFSTLNYRYYFQDYFRAVDDFSESISRKRPFQRKFYLFVSFEYMLKTIWSNGVYPQILLIFNQSIFFLITFAFIFPTSSQYSSPKIKISSSSFHVLNHIEFRYRNLYLTLAIVFCEFWGFVHAMFSVVWVIKHIVEYVWLAPCILFSLKVCQTLLIFFGHETLFKEGFSDRKLELLDGIQFKKKNPLVFIPIRKNSIPQNQLYSLLAA